MGITVRRHFAPLASVPLTTVDLMRDVGEMVKLRILDRTVSGLDVDGQAFASYSEGYAKAKAAERGGILGSMARVDLQLSGEMLANMTVTAATEKSVTVGFTR